MVIESVNGMDSTDDDKDDTHSGAGLNLHLLTFLLVAATFVWVTGTPTLQEVQKAEWEKEVIAPGEGDMMPWGETICTDNVKHDKYWVGARYVPENSGSKGTCFTKEMNSHLQLEVYGLKVILW